MQAPNDRRGDHQLDVRPSGPNSDVGQAQHGIADHAAETGRQRPLRALRQARREARSEQRAASQNASRIHSRSNGRCVSDRQPQTATGSNQHDRGEPEQLHHQVGGDRRRRVPSRLRTGAPVAWLQLRVLHRPGRQRDRDQRRQREQRHAAEFARRGGGSCRAKSSDQIESSMLRSFDAMS